MSVPNDALSAWRPTRIRRGDAGYATLVAFLAWVFSVYDFILFGILLPPISADFGWSTATGTAIATAVSVGTFIVAIAVGPLVDWVGRRRGMIITTAGAAVSSGLTALTPGAGWLVGVRSLAGLGYSEQAVNATYLNEIYASVEDGGRPRRRGLLYSLVQGGWPIGVVFASLLTSVLLPLVGWRGVFLIATFPAIVIALLGRRLKESPKFEVLKRARDLHKDGRVAEATALAEAHGVEPGRKSGLSRFGEVFTRGIRRHTVCLALAFLLNWFGIQVLAVLGTTVLTEGTGVSFDSALQLLILSNVVAYIGYVAHGFVGDRIGRRETIAVGWVLSGTAFGIMLLAANGTAVLVMYVVGLFFLIGPYSALLFYVGESFPTRIRGTGASLVNAMGPLGGIAGAALLTGLLNAGQTMRVAAFFSGALAILLSGLVILGARRIRPADPDIDTLETTSALDVTNVARETTVDTAHQASSATEPDHTTEGIPAP